MNIFYIDTDPRHAAQMMTDRHVVKMILESAQMLSTAHRELDGDVNGDVLYKSAYVNHPSTAWVRASLGNYAWLYEHFVALNDEYTARYGKVHKSFSRLNHVICHPPRHIVLGPFTPPPCCMPEQYQKYDDHVKNYRAYYIGEKLKTKKDTEHYHNMLWKLQGIRQSKRNTKFYESY